MSYKLNKKLCPSGLSNSPNKNLRGINYITIHTTGNSATTATAKSHADYLYKGSGGKQASWHYTVDKDDIWQSFEDNRACWHAGDGNGGGNMESIGIEICNNDKANFATACDSACQLVADLLKRYNLPLDRVVQHNNWSGKDCPKEIRAGNWGINWVQFIERVERYMANEIKPTDNEPSSWAKDAWEWGKKNGVTDGGNPKGIATREQVVQMISNSVHKT